MVCDGLKGLPEVVGERVAAGDGADLHHPPDPQHLPARLQRDWDELKRDVKPIYTAVNAAAARAAFDELAEKWGQRYPAIIRLWDNAWAEFIPFLDYDIEIRKVICSHERDRDAERPLPAGGQGPRPLPDRAGRAEVPLPGDPVPGPDRDRPGPDGRCGGSRPSTLSPSPSATGSRPPRPTNKTAGNTVSETDPSAPVTEPDRDASSCAPEGSYRESSAHTTLRLYPVGSNPTGC